MELSRCNQNRRGVKLFDESRSNLFTCNGINWEVHSPLNQDLHASDSNSQISYCPDGWTHYSKSLYSGENNNCMCYKYVNRTLKWLDAQKTCRNDYMGNLTSIIDLDHLDWLWRENIGRNSFWIGLTKRRYNATWRYVDGYQGHYRNWAPRPSIAQNKRVCALVSERLSWLQEICSHPHFFVCQRFCL